jgi:hypothetical protein
MKRFGFEQGVAAVAVLLAFATAGQAQDEGIKQVEQLVKKAGSTVEAIGSTKVQLLKMMEVYNGLMADGATDRKGAYKKLQQEMATTEKRRAEITLRAEEMKLEAETLFRNWASAALAIGDPELRKKSEERLAGTKASCNQIGTVSRAAADLYGPVMKALQDQITYLGHDLNASAVASLKPAAAKLNEQVQELVKRIDDTITTANAAIGALRPQ